jgi:hypothetical protein
MPNVLGPVRNWIAPLAVLVFLFSAVPIPSHAADGPDEVKQPKVRNPLRPYAIRHPLPFKFGERLVYDVKFHKAIITANVGDLSFAVLEPAGSKQHVKFEVNAVSKGALVSLFGVKVQDVFTTLADRDDLFVYSTIKNLDEGDTRSRQESVFDRQSKTVRFTVSNPAVPTQPPTVTTSESRPWVQDVVSAFYFTRTRKLKNDNREVSFYISDEGKSYHIGVARLGTEEVKTDVGTFKTIKVDARIFNGRFVRKEGQLHVWLTDDARRIPVKAWLKLPAGTVTFELKSFEEGTTPITASKAPVEDEDEDQ